MNISKILFSVFQLENLFCQLILTFFRMLQVTRARKLLTHWTNFAIPSTKISIVFQNMYLNKKIKIIKTPPHSFLFFSKSFVAQVHGGGTLIKSHLNTCSKNVIIDNKHDPPHSLTHKHNIHCTYNRTFMTGTNLCGFTWSHSQHSTLRLQFVWLPLITFVGRTSTLKTGLFFFVQLHTQLCTVSENINLKSL